MANSFADLSFGTVITANSTVADQTVLDSFTFVGVAFEREEWLLPPGGKPKLPLRFNVPQEMRELRNRCRAWEGTGLPLIAAKRGTAHDHCVLQFMFPAMAFVINGDIPLKVEPEALSDAVGIADTKGLQKLVEKLVLQTGPFGAEPQQGKAVRRFLMRRPPVFFAEDYDEQALIVKLILSDAKCLACRIETNGLGRHYLHATAVEPRGNEGDTFTRVHAISLEGDIRFVQDTNEVPNNELGKLIVESSPLLNAWASYHRASHEERQRLFLQRSPVPLVFSLPKPASKGFSVRLGNWKSPEVRTAWTDDGDLCRNKKKRAQIDCDIMVRGKNDAQADGVCGRLASITDAGEARFSLEKRKTPPEHGLIEAVDRGNRQDEKRKKAAEKLQTGDVALPTLLDFLSAPGEAPPAKRRRLKTGKARFNETQLDAIEHALGNQSIVAVQGPPGTGKTHVIAEVMERLLANSTDGPLRLLVASEQNSAVDNVMEKLAARGVIIHRALSATAAQRAKEEGRDRDFGKEADEIKGKVGASLRDHKRLRCSVEAVGQLRGAARSLAAWPEEPENVRARLATIAGGEEWSSAVQTMLAGQLDDARKLLRRWPDDAPSDDADSTAEEALLRIEEMFAGDVMQLDTLAGKRELDALAEGVVAAGLHHVAERASDALRAVRKAQRRDDPSRCRETIDDLLGTVRAASTAVGADKNDTDLELHELLTEIANWRSRVLGTIEVHLAQQRKSKAGVLSEWLRALEEDPNLWESIQEKYAQVTGATCQMAAGSRDPMHQRDDYDYVIIDEAARSEVFELLIPMVQGKRILLVGDQKQLPPLVEQALVKKMQKQGVRIDAKWFEERTLFGELLESLPEKNRFMLNTQYRSNPAIGDAVSRAFYDGKLYSGATLPEGPRYAEWLASKQPDWGLYDNRPLVWLDSATAATHICEYGNEAEVEIAEQLVTRLVDAQEGQHEVLSPFIGVIAFYKDQADALRNALHKTPRLRRCTVVNTVDAFQGMEFPAIVLSCSRHDPGRAKVGFLAFPNRINVALSRAQKQLFIVGSVPTLLHRDSNKGSQPLKTFVTAAGDALYVPPMEEA
ncbi:MAG: AAA family ATPase [Verrucomicrobia bacterium]|jgi:hypothetical protein|nr:AAA family ATPase [Verrucomicrobiota bacterium]